MEWLRELSVVSQLLIAWVSLIVALLIAHRIRRARQRMRLLQEGVPIVGTCISRRTVIGKTGSVWQLAYEYTVAGRTRRRRTGVSKATYDRAREGKPIELRYLPAQPEVAAPIEIADSGRLQI